MIYDDLGVPRHLREPSYPNSWMVYFMENLCQWMMTGGTPMDWKSPCGTFFQETNNMLKNHGLQRQLKKCIGRLSDARNS